MRFITTNPVDARQVPPEAASVRRSSPPSPGELLDGRLRLTRHLGAGGQSEVFAAWDPVLAAAVAVKVARDEDHDGALRQLRAEVHPLRDVCHRNLIRLLDVCDAPERCYLVLEALDPVSLAARVQRARLAPAEAVRVLVEVATALDALHRKGWAHRDVKAENVLFGFDGRAVLTDLGLACHAAGCDGCVSGSRGTPAYMAPEVISDDARDFAAWARADQYALAVTAFYALTGAMPYAGESVMAVLFAHLAAPVPTVSSVRPELARFDEALLRALSKDPQERFASVRSFAEALQDAL